MNIPLPRVVPDVEAGGPFVTSMRGQNALTESALQNAISKSAAQYAPYTNYANAASKIAYANMLPYQIQAQVMSNPMMWMAMKDNPEALKSMVGNFQQSIPQSNNVFGGMNIPQPGNPQPNMGNGVFGALMNKLFGGQSNNQSQNPMQQMPQVGSAGQATPQEVANIAQNGNGTDPNGAAAQMNSPLMPQKGMQGAIDIKTAPYNEQLHKPGTAFVDPTSGKVYSTPTDSSVSAAQNAINAAKRVEPQLERLADLAAPFLSVKGKANMQWERVKNLFNPESKNPGKLPTQYAEFNSVLQGAPEALVKSYGLRPTNETIERMQKVIEPYNGETKDQYKNRIQRQLKSIHDEQIGVSQQQLSQGFDLSNNSPEEPKASAGKIKLYNPKGFYIGQANPENAKRFLKDHEGYYSGNM